MTDITSHSHSTDDHGSVEIPHTLRVTDTDPRAARRAERQVVTMFLLSMLLVVLFVVAYIGIDKSTTIYLPVFGEVGASNIALGFCLGAAVFLIGAGAIQWAKKLMPDVEVVQQRHEMNSPSEASTDAAGHYQRGKEESGFARYKAIRRTLIGALILFPIPLVIMLKDLWVPTEAEQGMTPNEILSETMWEDGMLIGIDGVPVEVEGEDGAHEILRPIKPEDLPVGGLISALPASILEVEHLEGNLNARGKSAIILVRMDPTDIRSQQGDGWDYQGILAFSKICTHVGCPIALYEQRTHHLLCPCHQSTFDLADSGNVIFGPAARRMPQLPIGVNAEGYLVAKSDFAEPVGPSF